MVALIFVLLSTWALVKVFTTNVSTPTPVPVETKTTKTSKRKGA